MHFVYDSSTTTIIQYVMCSLHISQGRNWKKFWGGVESPKLPPPGTALIYRTSAELPCQWTYK